MRKQKLFLGSLVLCSTVLLTSCNSLEGIVKAYEKANYGVKTLNIKQTETTTSETSETNKSPLDSVTWVYKSMVEISSYGFILEFNVKNAVDAYNTIKEEKIVDDETMQKLIDSYKDQTYFNGNCALLTCSSSTAEIFKNA